MTNEQLELYNKTVRRLARGGIKDPTAQIIALAEEIERYRVKIHGMEAQLLLGSSTIPVAPSTKPRYTQYDVHLGRFVVPLLYTSNDDSIIFQLGMAGRHHPDCVMGRVIDKLAEYENQLEEAET